MGNLNLSREIRLPTVFVQRGSRSLLSGPDFVVSLFIEASQSREAIGFVKKGGSDHGWVSRASAAILKRKLIIAIKSPSLPLS